MLNFLGGGTVMSALILGIRVLLFALSVFGWLTLLHKKTDAAMASVLWSEQRDLNPRPPRPERGALPTALCPEKPQRQGCGLVGDERIELPQVESESTALPLCKSPSYRRRRRTLAAADKGYYTLSGRGCQLFFSTGGGRPGWWHLLQKVRKKP